MTRGPDRLTASLTALHVEQVTRPRRGTGWQDDQVEAPDAETIGTLVKTPAHVVCEHAPLAPITQVIIEHDVVIAVVDSSAALCGVITATDVLAAGADWTAADAMSSMLAVRASTKIDEVAELMAREHAPHVVVTDAVGQVVGIVTAREIARHRANR